MRPRFREDGQPLIRRGDEPLEFRTLPVLGQGRLDRAARRRAFWLGLLALLAALAYLL